MQVRVVRFPNVSAVPPAWSPDLDLVPGERVEESRAIQRAYPFVTNPKTGARTYMTAPHMPATVTLRWSLGGTIYETPDIPVSWTLDMVLLMHVADAVSVPWNQLTLRRWSEAKWSAWEASSGTVSLGALPASYTVTVHMWNARNCSEDGTRLLRVTRTVEGVPAGLTMQTLADWLRMFADARLGSWTSMVSFEGRSPQEVTLLTGNVLYVECAHVDEGRPAPPPFAVSLAGVLVGRHLLERLRLTLGDACVGVDHVGIPIEAHTSLDAQSVLPGTTVTAIVE